MIFSFHLRVVKQICIEKKRPEYFPEGVDENRFDNVYITQVLSCSFTGIVSIDLTALIAAYF